MCLQFRTTPVSGNEHNEKVIINIPLLPLESLTGPSMACIKIEIPSTLNSEVMSTAV